MYNFVSFSFHFLFSGDLLKNATVRLHAVLEENAFKSSRFHIGKNNIRKRWFLQVDDDLQDQNGKAYTTPGKDIKDCPTAQDK